MRRPRGLRRRLHQRRRVGSPNQARIKPNDGQCEHNHDDGNAQNCGHSRAPIFPHTDTHRRMDGWMCTQVDLAAQRRFSVLTRHSDNSASGPARLSNVKCGIPEGVQCIVPGRLDSSLVRPARSIADLRPLVITYPSWKSRAGGLPPCVWAVRCFGMCRCLQVVTGDFMDRGDYDLSLITLTVIPCSALIDF